MSDESDRTLSEREADHWALEVLCRVFDDGADVAFEEWLAWYKPAQWLAPSRALGAFIYGRLLDKRQLTENERAGVNALRKAMQAAMGTTRVDITMHDANAILAALASPFATPGETT